MKYLLLILILVNFVNSTAVHAATRLVRSTKTVPYYNYYPSDAYLRDIDIVENYLFGANYTKDNFDSRLSRIERQIFSKTYTSLSTARRMNNILSHYRDDYNRNYLSNYYKTTTPAQRIINRFVGQPTGFTPPIVNTPYNDYGYPMGINRSYYTNRGYGYHNTLPVGVGAGVHILD